jgi:hypothetical protein
MQGSWKSEEEFRQWVIDNRYIDNLLMNAMVELRKDKTLRKYYKKLKKIYYSPLKESDEQQYEKKKIKILFKISSFLLDDDLKLKDPAILTFNTLDIRKRKEQQRDDHSTKRPKQSIDLQQPSIPESWSSEADFQDWVIEKGIIDKVLIEALPHLKDNPNPFIELRYNKIKRLQNQSKSVNMKDKEILLSNTDYLFIKKEGNVYKLKDVTLFQNLLK